MWPDVGDGEPIYLWTESYDRSLHITTRDFTAAVHNDVGLSYRLEPGDDAERVYYLRPDTPNLQPGIYRLPIEVDVFNEDESLAERRFEATVVVAEDDH